MKPASFDTTAPTQDAGFIGDKFDVNFTPEPQDLLIMREHVNGYQYGRM
jgi:hypothetical protein